MDMDEDMTWTWIWHGHGLGQDFDMFHYREARKCRIPYIEHRGIPLNFSITEFRGIPRNSMSIPREGQMYENKKDPHWQNAVDTLNGDEEVKRQLWKETY